MLIDKQNPVTETGDGGFKLSKNFVFVDVGAGAHTGPTVESLGFADTSYKLQHL